MEQVKRLKNPAVSIFGEVQFQLHKWHSNYKELETEDSCGDVKQAFAANSLE